MLVLACVAALGIAGGAEADPGVDSGVASSAASVSADAQGEAEFRLLHRGKDDLELVRFIRERILRTSRESAPEEMRAYVEPFSVDPESVRPGAPLSTGFAMVAIPGGEFRMGSPSGATGAKADEHPRHDVRVSPFWMGRHEVTWGLYYPFMLAIHQRHPDGSLRGTRATQLADVVSAPTVPYIDMTFGMGEGPEFPAVCMTQHAASKFCQWLSLKTGHYYRLPTEAEWEFACRAGSSEDYHFGSDPGRLGDYAWFWDNAGDRYHEVGRKLPNQWGLHDMLGNVREWCLDQYAPGTYAARDALQDDSSRVDPIVRALQLHPRVARGGSFYDDAADCRAASRSASTPDWQRQDPELPQSRWYLTDAHWLGFRVVRPLAIPSAEEMHFLWNSGDPALLAAPDR